MICDCGNRLTVTESVSRNGRTFRKRVCKACGNWFVTEESACDNKYDALAMLFKLKQYNYASRMKARG